MEVISRQTVTAVTFRAGCCFLFTSEAAELEILCNFIAFEPPAAAAAAADDDDDAVAVGRDFCSHDVVFADNKNVSISQQCQCIKLINRNSAFVDGTVVECF